MDSNSGGQPTSDLQRKAAAEIARRKVLAAYGGAEQEGVYSNPGLVQQASPQPSAGSTGQQSPQPGATPVAPLTSTQPLTRGYVRPVTASASFQQNTMQSASSNSCQSTGQSAYAAPNAPHLKDEPINPQISSDSWRKYHTAWQDYYQKYYNDYYSKAARDYIAKEQLKAARKQAEEDEIIYSLTKSGSKIDHKSGLNLHERSAPEIAGNLEITEEDTIRNRLRYGIRKKATDSAKRTRKFRRFVPLMAGVAVVLLILFLQYNRLIFAPIMAYVSPGNAPASEIEALDPTITQTVSADPRLIIPKINVDVPIRFGVALDDVMSAMNDGVAHYRIAGASAYPGQMGNFIITGHSAGDIYSSNSYKYIFSGLERLEDGDLIYVNYNSTRYTYRIFTRKVVEPSDVASLVMGNDRRLITLVTCTPLGTSRYRLLVTGEQISPVGETATPSDPAPVEDEEDTAELPSNEPSFFEGIWNWLTGQG